MSGKSRLTFDTSTFTFTHAEDKLLCSISALGSEGEIVTYSIREDIISILIAQLESIQKQNYSGKLKIRTGSTNINLKFSGFKKEKGVKVRSYLTNWFYYSSAGFGAYTSDSNFGNLVNNLKRCVE